MTVHYSHQVATEKLGGGFFRLLFRWRGSMYRAVYGEIAVFLVLYYSLNFVYRFGLSEPYKTVFEKVCLSCQESINSMPLTLVLGFYLVRVITRRWTMWENIPWPDRFGLDVSCYVEGFDMKSRIVRRTLVRYVNLAAILCYRDICLPVKKRFPTMEHLVSAGLLTLEELEIFLTFSSKRTANWWIPFHWSYMLVRRLLREGKLSENEMLRLHDVRAKGSGQKSIVDLRNKCNVLFTHDWMPVPLIYTQVATLSVYLYMAVSLLGRQWLDPEKSYTKHAIDLYIPIFTIIETIFYLGWLKVAEIIINPMGEDDEDFDMNYIVDRNLKVAYAMVDEAYNKSPPVEKDLHWGQVDPTVLYTTASRGLKNTPFIGSATTIKLNPTQVQQIVNESGSSTDNQSNCPLMEESVDLTVLKSTAKATGRKPSLHRTSTVYPVDKPQPAVSVSKFKKFSLYRKNAESVKVPTRKCFSQNALPDVSESNDNLLLSIQSDKSNQ